MITPSSVITSIWCDEASALTTWRRPISKFSEMSCAPYAPSPNDDAVQLRVDVDLGARRVVVPGAVVHPRTAHLVGQPRPAALDRRFRRDLQRLLDGGLVADRRVELNDHRRCDTDDLTVGQLELTVDLVVGVDGGELARHGDGLAVVADHRAAPGVGNAVAERFGGVETGAVTVERARDGLAFGVDQRDALEPAVLHLHAHGRDGRDIGGRIGGLVGDRRGGRRCGGARGRVCRSCYRRLRVRPARRLRPQGRSGPAVD